MGRDSESYRPPQRSSQTPHRPQVVHPSQSVRQLQSHPHEYIVRVERCACALVGLAR